MTKLSKFQIAYLGKIGVPLKDVFDATGIRSRDYKLIMKDLGKLVAFGVTPCAAGGHTLRTRAGHCVQCNSANLGYLKRHDSAGYVYVAWSQAGKISKIGFSTDIDKRIESLNYFKYGNQSDWLHIESYHCENAGEIETKAQKILSKHIKQGLFYSNGSITRHCSELFRCSYQQAALALNQAIQEMCEIVEN